MTAPGQSSFDAEWKSLSPEPPTVRHGGANRAAAAMSVV
jgi:hypothetical protein